jgi:hypothetical protein
MSTRDGQQITSKCLCSSGPGEHDDDFIQRCGFNYASLDMQVFALAPCEAVHYSDRSFQHAARARRRYGATLRPPKCVTSFECKSANAVERLQNAACNLEITKEWLKEEFCTAASRRRLHKCMHALHKCMHAYASWSVPGPFYRQRRTKFIAI